MILLMIYRSMLISTIVDWGLNFWVRVIEKHSNLAAKGDVDIVKEKMVFKERFNVKLSQLQLFNIILKFIT